MIVDLDVCCIVVTSYWVNRQHFCSSHWSQTELGDRCSNDFTVVQLKVKINMELMMLLFSYNDAIEVLGPERLRRSFADTVRKMNQFYEL